MKKKLLTATALVLSAVLLVAAGVLGTLAFFAASSAVSNTFTVGDVKIQMLESKTDENGVDLDGADTRTVDGNSYRLVPTKTYVKDPAIYVEPLSEPSYLFVKVKNGISTIEKPDNTMKDQMIANGWQLVKNNLSGEELYLYLGKDELGVSKATDSLATGALDVKFVGSAQKETVELFNTFTVDTNADVTDYAGAKVTLTAFAIQKAGFDDANGLTGYQNAWNAIVGRFPFESGTVFTAVAP